MAQYIPKPNRVFRYRDKLVTFVLSQDYCCSPDDCIFFRNADCPLFRCSLNGELGIYKYAHGRQD